jgi:hypothetical protein
MPDRWRSPMARLLARAVEAAGGTIERTGRGRIRVTGPAGSITIQEPGSETRPDLARDSVARKIAGRTGLVLTADHGKPGTR